MTNEIHRCVYTTCVGMRVQVVLTMAYNAVRECCFLSFVLMLSVYDFLENCLFFQLSNILSVYYELPIACTCLISVLYIAQN